MLTQARVVEEDVGKAKEWFAKAAQRGHVPSQYELGLTALNEERFEYAYRRCVSKRRQQIDFAHFGNNLYMYTQIHASVESWFC